MERERPEHEERELSGVARSQNAVYVLPHDATSLADVLEPALDRVSAAGDGVELLALTSDADTAVAVARMALERTPHGAPAIPVTSARRAARLLSGRRVSVVAGTPGELLELVRNAALKLNGVRTVLIAWTDTLLDAGEAAALEAVLAEVPKDAARLLVTSRLTSDVEQLIERYARRARRVGDLSPADSPSAELRYLATAPGARAGTLRRLLDELDPERGAVYARTEAARDEVRRLLTALGVAEGEAPISLTEGEGAVDVPLLVLYELPASRSELRTLVGEGRPTIVALIQPRQLGALRALAGGERVTPFSLAGPGARARSRDDSVRDELRAVIVGDVPARELLTLEPLLEDFDGIEIAAAALRLLERERARPAVREAPPARTPAAPAGTRVFINAGARDNVGPGDLLGTISGEAGIPGSRIGRIEVRDNHSLVEVDPADAEKIVRALTGVSIRGRRVVARVDSERGPRERPREEGPPRDDRPVRGARGGFADRPRRDDRSRRDERPRGDDRPRRDDRFERDRMPRERAGRDRAPRSAPPRGGRNATGSAGPRSGPRDPRGGRRDSAPRDRPNDFRERRERGPRERPSGERQRRRRYDAE